MEINKNNRNSEMVGGGLEVGISWLNRHTASILFIQIDAISFLFLFNKFILLEQLM